MQDDSIEVAVVELAAVESNTLAGTMERLAAATEMLEQAVAKMFDRQNSGEELELKLAAAQSELAELKHAPVAVTHGRKTLPLSLTGKHGMTVDSVEGGALDAALVSLSIEQRIAVKTQLMRAGLLG